MPDITGFLTVTDITDGRVGSAVIFQNENHTYVADADGAVAAGERTMFSNFIDVEAGDVNITYAADTDTTLAADNTFTIPSTAVNGQSYRNASSVTVTPSGADITVRLTAAGDGVTMTVVDTNTSATTGFFDAGGANSIIITVPVTVRTGGRTVTYNKVVSLTKAIGGSAPYVRMTSTDQSIEYAFGASSPKNTGSTFTMTALSFNTPASVSGTSNTGEWFTSTNGSSWTLLTDGSLPSGYTVTGEGTNNSTLTVTHAAFNTTAGSANRVLYRFQRGAAANTYSATAVADQISVYKVFDAEGGYDIRMEITGGTDVFKNNPTYAANDPKTYCDITARLYRSGEEITSGLTYRWYKNGVATQGTDEGSGASGSPQLSIDQGSGATDTNLRTNYGVTTRRIRVGGADITDDGAEVWSCRITFT